MKYVLGIIGAFLVFLIFLLLVVNKISKPISPRGKQEIVVSDYAKDSTTVKMTQQGRLVGDTERRSIVISITDNQRKIEIVSGYDQKVISSETYPNTESGFQTFLSALGQAGFGRERNSAIKDVNAACPLGRRFVYQLQKDQKDQLNTWDTTCQRSEGTFAGDSSVIRRLFQMQIPEYNIQIRKVVL